MTPHATPRRAVLTLLFLAVTSTEAFRPFQLGRSFVTTATRGGEVTRATSTTSTTIACAATRDASANNPTTRRGVLGTGAATLPLAALSFVVGAPPAARAEEATKEKVPTELPELRLLLKESMAQLDEVCGKPSRIRAYIAHTISLNFQ